MKDTQIKLMRYYFSPIRFTKISEVWQPSIGKALGMLDPSRG